MLNLESAILALLLPAGLISILVAGLAGRRPAQSAVTALGALALAAIGFWACGFAFHLGGVGLVTTLPGLEGLVWEWASPLNLNWGVLGLRGFWMLDEAATPAALALYLAWLPPLAVAVLLPMLSLRERAPGWIVALGGAWLAAVVYPVAGNWFSGGGWLMHIGETLGLGHDYVDVTGLSTAALVGSLAALLGILFFGRRLPPLPVGAGLVPAPDLVPALPPVYLPVLATLGAILVAVGGIGLYGHPPVGAPSSWVPLAAVNLVLGAAAGILLPCLYTWFTAGAADSLMAARGAAAGVLSMAAAAPFIPPWAALAVGATAGLLVPLVTFVARYVLRIDDPTGAVPMGLVGGVLGILAPGLTQGWPGQINAQLIGLAAMAALTTALVGALFLILKVLLLLLRAVPAPQGNGYN